MLVLAKATLALMIGFLLSAFFGLIAIPQLKRIKAKQNISIFLRKEHSSKQGVPTIGGIIFIIPTVLAIIILLLMGKIEYHTNLMIVLVTFLLYALLGFLDDFISIKRGNNIGLTEIQKLIGQVLIALVFFWLFTKAGNQTNLDITFLNIDIPLGPIYPLFVLFILVATTNAVNITDGLDGLAGGLSAIAFIAYGLISWGSIGIAGYESIAVFCFVLVGSILGFLIYNSHPAKVIMGDTGSLALGGALAAVAILTRHEITLIVVAGVFVIETLSAIIQRFVGRYWGKRVFLMAPLHHHFEKLGWSEQDIVKLFWAVGLMLAMAAIIYGVWI
jgi:phospho-N-acetylmuramoyl-pentapeptide-transferase